MILTILTILLLIIAVEATTEIITSSKLVSPLQTKWREWTYPIDRPPPTGIVQAVRVFIDNLWNCGYCASVWVAAFYSAFAPIIIQEYFINWLVFVFVLHRLSNWMHVIYELMKRGRVNSLDILLRVTEDCDGTIGQSVGEATTEVTTEHFESGGSA